MALRRLLLTLLLPALLLAQSLGFAHAVAHAGGQGPLQAAHAPHAPHIAMAADAAAPATQGHADVASTFDLLFGGHDAGSCRLYDQVTHGDLVVPHVDLPQVLPPSPVVVAALDGLALARWAALYDARGPPAAL